MDSKEMAERTTILRTQSGSQLYGLNLPGGSDRDEMGVCIEDIEFFCGFHEFEQYEYRTAAERENKKDAPSQDGDLDLTIYGLRKFLRLAMHGNPSVLQLLFVQYRNCIKRDPTGEDLQRLAPYIVSRQAGNRFLGYLNGQKMKLLGEIGQKKVNRPELEEKHGYDTKFAMHMLRLGYQGVELLTTGSLALPIQGPKQEFLMAVRLGKIDLQEVLQTTGDLERELKDLIHDSPLQDKPDEVYVQEWMIDTYFNRWNTGKKTLFGKLRWGKPIGKSLVDYDATDPSSDPLHS